MIRCPFSGVGAPLLCTQEILYIFSQSYIYDDAYSSVGTDALIEIDPEASDLSRGILALRDVAAEAGVSKYAIPGTYIFIYK